MGGASGVGRASGVFSGRGGTGSEGSAAALGAGGFTPGGGVAGASPRSLVTVLGVGSVAASGGGSTTPSVRDESVRAGLTMPAGGAEAKSSCCEVAALFLRPAVAASVVAAASALVRVPCSAVEGRPDTLWLGRAVDPYTKSRIHQVAPPAPSRARTVAVAARRRQRRVRRASRSAPVRGSAGPAVRQGSTLNANPLRARRTARTSVGAPPPTPCVLPLVRTFARDHVQNAGVHEPPAAATGIARGLHRLRPRRFMYEVSVRADL